MTFSGASSAIGDYIPQFSSNCSRLEKFSDLYQTFKFCRGACCRSRAHFRRRSHLAHPESNCCAYCSCQFQCQLFEFTTRTLVKRGSFYLLRLRSYALQFLVSCLAGGLSFRTHLVTYRVWGRKVNAWSSKTVGQVWKVWSERVVLRVYKSLGDGGVGEAGRLGFGQVEAPKPAQKIEFTYELQRLFSNIKIYSSNWNYFLQVKINSEN